MSHPILTPQAPRKAEPFAALSTTRPLLWVVRSGERFLYFRGPTGQPVWGPHLTRARRFDSADAVWQAARWAGGVALELEAVP